MNQDENQRARVGDPRNWGKILGFYHSKLDSRVWVPKRSRMGWSLETRQSPLPGYGPYLSSCCCSLLALGWLS